MKAITIATKTLTVGVGTAVTILTRTSKPKARKPMMTFKELYEDNLYSDNILFDWEQV